MKVTKNKKNHTLSIYTPYYSMYTIHVDRELAVSLNKCIVNRGYSGSGVIRV